MDEGIHTFEVRVVIAGKAVGSKCSGILDNENS